LGPGEWGRAIGAGMRLQRIGAWQFSTPYHPQHLPSASKVAGSLFSAFSGKQPTANNAGADGNLSDWSRKLVNHTCRHVWLNQRSKLGSSAAVKNHSPIFFWTCRNAPFGLEPCTGSFYIIHRKAYGCDRRNAAVANRPIIHKPDCYCEGVKTIKGALRNAFKAVLIVFVVKGCKLRERRQVKSIGCVRLTMSWIISSVTIWFRCERDKHGMFPHQICLLLLAMCYRKMIVDSRLWFAEVAISEKRSPDDLPLFVRQGQRRVSLHYRMKIS
jgi:hypothetical protein